MVFDIIKLSKHAKRVTLCLYFITYDTVHYQGVGCLNA